MRAFGLFDTIGEGAGATVKLSTRGLDIASDYPRESPEWVTAVKKAALSPKVHNQLWQKYGASPPPDDELRRYLLRDLKFNDNSVGGFIEEYKTTIAFAKLSTEDIIGGGEGEIAVGSFIQWTSDGVEQFAEPRRVESITEDGEWVFVENNGTGIPMAEATLVESPPPKAPSQRSGGSNPPPNPNFKPPAFDGPRIEFPLPNGNSIEIRLKKRVAKKDFDRIKKLVDLSEDSLVETGDGS